MPAPSATLTTTKANSWVFGVGVDWDLGRVLAPSANATMVNQVISSSQDTYWVERLSTPQVASPVPVTIGVTGTATDRWNFAVVEIRQP